MRKKTSKADKVRQLLAQGLSVKEIATKTKAPPSMIYTLRKKMNLKPKGISRTQLLEELKPGLNALFNEGNYQQNVDALITERGSRYGFFIGQATVSQELKKTVYAGLTRSGNTLDYDQLEALDMIVHKIARIVNGDPNYSDSWVDIAGYAKLVSDRLEGIVR